MMVGHHFVGEDSDLRTALQQVRLLADECPSDRCFLHLRLFAVVRECAEQRAATIGYHGDVHDAWLPPCAWLQPGEGFVG